MVWAEWVGKKRVLSGVGGARRAFWTVWAGPAVGHCGQRGGEGGGTWLTMMKSGKYSAVNGRVNGEFRNVTTSLVFLLPARQPPPPSTVAASNRASH